MVLDAGARICVSFAVASLVCLALYFFCKLKRDQGQSSAILLAEDEKQAKEKDKREKLNARLAPNCTVCHDFAHVAFTLDLFFTYLSNSKYLSSLPVTFEIVDPSCIC